ncbi:MAG: inosine monophosphate cyclohydrolase [SAR324 cluster bacterium]|nr:inosine monophosphate cyclohydrolase [SAR324 cluster bacterium]MBL7036154.1 inosine monophosphate cyclohydrolase [SAR324 cluster bacterium]
MQNELAEQNFQQHLAKNVYPGRGIVLGRSLNNSWLLIYWIMGRSSNSRNRIFRHQNGILRTEAADPSLVEDPALIIYNAMRDLDGKIIISNGSQTDTIYDGLAAGSSIYTALQTEKHEPDAPNFTPRISALIELQKSVMTLSKISKSDFSAEHSVYNYYRYADIPAGFGYCLTTYMGDGNPLPSFRGDPLLLPLEANAEETAERYWQALDADNRISLAVREFDGSADDSLKIINRFQHKN